MGNLSCMRNLCRGETTRETPTQSPLDPPLETDFEELQLLMLRHRYSMIRKKISKHHALDNKPAALQSKCV